MKRKTIAAIMAIASVLMIIGVTGCETVQETEIVLEQEIAVPAENDSAQETETVQEQEVTAPVQTDSQEAQDVDGVILVLEVTDDNGVVSKYELLTNQPTVGAALLEEGMIEGDESEYGLMVTHVNGLRADFNEDGAYWAFYVDGEFATAGVDATEIEQGRVYALVYTKA